MEGRLKQDNVVLGIREYYADRVILVTGVTGFLGTVLLEKILRDLADIRHIYVLLRPHSETSASDRFDRDVLSSPAFSTLRTRHGAGFDAFVEARVTAVHGDIERPDLGLEPALRARLTSELDTVINVAADVRFDAPLDVAFRTNTLGPQHLLALARDCVKPIVLGHVSTCYVSGSRDGLIAEEPLDPARAPDPRARYDVNAEVAAIQRIIARVTDASTSRLKIGSDENFRTDWIRTRMKRLGSERARRWGWNDVYSYTKALGEQLLARTHDDVPVVIVRPSIIESAIAQPMPGWIDKLRMADPLAVAYGRNHIPEFPGAAEYPLDVVPVDIVVNTVLAAVAAHHMEKGIAVYQAAAGEVNPMSLREFAWYVRESFDRATVQGRKRTRALPVLTYPSLPAYLRQLRYREMAPARAQQIVGRFFRSKPWGASLEQRARARRLALNRLHHQAALLGPYASLRCRYESTNVQRLWSMLGADERAAFNLDLASIDWRDYVRNVHIPGVQKYVLGMAREPAAPAAGTIAMDRANRVITPLPEPHVVARGAQRVTRSAFGIILNRYIGMTFEGLENAEGAAPFVAVSNHSSHADAAALMVLLNRSGRTVRPVAARDYFFSTPVKAWLSRTFLNAVPLERHAMSSTSVSLAVSLLRRGQSLIYFPEGGRSADGAIGEFKRGAAHVALAAGVPVLPIRITGSFDALPKGSWFPRRKRMHVRIGAPISAQTYLTRDTAESMQDRARRMTEDVRRAVALLGETDAG